MQIGITATIEKPGNMFSAADAIARFRRDLLIAALIRSVMGAAVIAAILVRPIVAPQMDGTILFVVIGGVWLALTWASDKGRQVATDVPGLIASGQFDEAETALAKSLQAFSIFRSGKLSALHSLALLRHTQRRWREAAMLCQAVLSQRLGPLDSIGRPTRLILADSMLELGDLQGAYDALSRLYDQRLSLNEVLKLLLIQLDYESRTGAWPAMMAHMMSKVELAELMPAEAAARVQALLAVAAGRIGRPDCATWLRRRAELLADPSRLAADRPVLAELWAGKRAGRAEE